MALAIGRIVTLLLVAVLVYFFDMRVAFIIAAVVSLFMIMLNAQNRLE